MLGATNGRGAAYPAAPYGMLFEGCTRAADKKGTARWLLAESVIAASCFITGLLTLLFTTLYLGHLTKVTGALVGVLLSASGATGWVGGRRRSGASAHLQLVTAVLGILLAFSLVSETVRDTQIDCALSELYLRGQHTAQQVAGVQQQEAMQAVFARLSEMEDHLTLVQQGAAKAVELKGEQDKLRSTDITYIRAKLDLVKRHAQELLDSVLKNPDVTVERIGRLSDADKAALRARMATADEVLARIQRHHAEAGGEITFDEYQALLAALSDTGTVPADRAAHPELQQAKAELPNMKAALERSRRDAYHQLQVGDAPRQLAQIAAVRSERKAAFEQQFRQLLARQGATGSDFVADLPQHCVRETAGEKVLVGCGLLAILLQVAAAYVALGLSLRLPIKGD